MADEIVELNNGTDGTADQALDALERTALVQSQVRGRMKEHRPTAEPLRVDAKRHLLCQRATGAEHGGGLAQQLRDPHLESGHRTA